jgi:GNAT superfamily N-acetyltransferase
MAELTAQAVQLSEIDTDRFGIRIARASHLTPDQLDHVLGYCGSYSIRMLIARCSTAELALAQEMERRGFLLMDTLVYYSFDFRKKNIPSDTGMAEIRTIRPGEEKEVRTIARESFRGYFGHYHADSALDRQACDDAYTSWAENSCVKEGFADHVLTAVSKGRLAGFATLRMNSPDEAEGVLFGVAPFAQGAGIYRSFIVRGLEWAHQRGAVRMVVSTQITNLAVQKVWVRVGYEPSHSFYTFHKWFD